MMIDIQTKPDSLKGKLNRKDVNCYFGIHQMGGRLAFRAQFFLVLLWRSPSIEAESVANPCIDVKMVFTSGSNGTAESERHSKILLSRAARGTLMGTAATVTEQYR